MSLASTTIVMWSSSSDSSPFYRAVFGYDEMAVFGLLALTYVSPFVFNLIVVAAVRGWRNRLVALVGIPLLLVPVAEGLWVGLS